MAAFLDRQGTGAKPIPVPSARVSFLPAWGIRPTSSPHLRPPGRPPWPEAAGWYPCLMDEARRHAKVELGVRNAVDDALADLASFPAVTTAGEQRLYRKACGEVARELSGSADTAKATLSPRNRALLLVGLRHAERAAGGTGGEDSQREAGRALRALASLRKRLPAGFGEPPAPSAAPDFSLRDRVLARSSELAALAGSCGLRDLVLFGSVARGEDDAGSDIDLAARTADGGYGDLAAVMGFSSKAGEMLGREVNLVLVGRRPSRVDAAIEREGLPLG